jgi:hypothetical protein
MTGKQQIAILKSEIRAMKKQLQGLENDRLRLDAIDRDNVWLTCEPKAWAGKWRCGTQGTYSQWCYGETARAAIDEWMHQFCQ